MNDRSEAVLSELADLVRLRTDRNGSEVSRKHLSDAFGISTSAICSVCACISSRRANRKQKPSNASEGFATGCE
jgi:hypothetical protein